ncbi:FAD-dependent oxidoreductase [Mangrovactinospora gilvigrisea]|uniref:FAD-dependent oxidoreductase n=1 Tax=Mangrovactinospora gilvigrisea TaxID=1428644 RepID=A0A1J7C1L3_9ACTN|nr:FAD-dependent oxidoreductase [Mangrovactinospora gilvigrisea]OIV35456.1 FAD-dependent oxidoreductase [Mangrovactinospora gilvigrisea]
MGRQTTRGHLGSHPALAGAGPVPFWLDSPDRPAAEPALTAGARADLLVVGGGYSGLWTALLAKERDPGLDVLLLEGAECAWAASGRNGGFCAASLTHGYDNGRGRWPEEIGELERLGLENLDQIEETVGRLGIDCDFRRTGEIHVATEEYQKEYLLAEAEAASLGGRPRRIEPLTAEQVRAELDSPRFLAGVWDRDGIAMVDPARLAWGLKRACLEAGVRIHEHTPVAALDDGRGGAPLTARTRAGARVTADRAVLATNAFRSLVPRLRAYTVPVWDYALMTEPLSDAQLASIGGWSSRCGVSDSANRFHYFRMTADHRILWGGYDAVAHFAGRVERRHEHRPETFDKLAEQFFDCFPQLAEVRFGHAWGGAIDTCSRFCAFFGTARGGRVAYASGYTGLGVGATRFGARVMLDLLDGADTELTRLEMVRKRPMPFPPEPVRYAGIQFTRAAMAAADRREGRRNLWLRALDRMGIGFDS